MSWGSAESSPNGPGKKTGVSTFLKFSMLLRLLGQQFHYTVHCNIGGNSRVVENNGTHFNAFSTNAAQYKLIGCSLARNEEVSIV